MNNMLKATVATISLVSVLGLTACQSQQAAPEKDGHRGPERGEMHHKKGGEYRGEKRKALTAEQKAEMKKRHEERKATMQALEKACEGKAGQAISVKIGEQTFDGKCEVRFKPNRPDPKQAPQAGQPPMGQPPMGEPPVDAPAPASNS